MNCSFPMGSKLFPSGALTIECASIYICVLVTKSYIALSNRTVDISRKSDQRLEKVYLKGYIHHVMEYLIKFEISNFKDDAGKFFKITNLTPGHHCTIG